MENGEERKIGVIGAGSWGTALADLMAEKGHDVTLWVREDEVYEGLVRERKNPVFLPDVLVNPALKPVHQRHDGCSSRLLMEDRLYRDRAARQLRHDARPLHEEQAGLAPAFRAQKRTPQLDLGASGHAMAT